MQTDTKSWDDAHTTCQNMQGELAAVTEIGKIKVGLQVSNSKKYLN